MRHRLSTPWATCTRKALYTGELTSRVPPRPPRIVADNFRVSRDLKPENLLLDDAFRIKITDFGTGKLLDSGGRDPVHLPACSATNLMHPQVNLLRRLWALPNMSPQSSWNTTRVARGAFNSIERVQTMNST